MVSFQFPVGAFLWGHRKTWSIQLPHIHPQFQMYMSHSGLERKGIPGKTCINSTRRDNIFALVCFLRAPSPDLAPRFFVWGCQRRMGDVDSVCAYTAAR